jgi:hypothetical protein
MGGTRLKQARPLPVLFTACAARAISGAPANNAMKQSTRAKFKYRSVTGIPLPESGEEASQKESCPLAAREFINR